MNNSKHLLSLLQNNFRTVHVIFDNGQEPVFPTNGQANEPWSQAPTTRATPTQLERRAQFAQKGAPLPQKSYVYKCHNDMAVEPGSRAVVIRDDGSLYIVTVVKVDDFADIDLAADHQYKWIVDVLDFTRYNDILDKEAKFSRLVTEAQRVKMREETIASFRSALPTEGEAAKLFDEAFGLFNGAAGVKAE